MLYNPSFCDIVGMRWPDKLINNSEGGDDRTISAAFPTAANVQCRETLLR